MIKLCECGCGMDAPIAKQTNQKIGHTKGEPCRFVQGHVKFNGGLAHHTEGYIQIRKKDHPRVDNRGYVFEHILVVEKALGHYLPVGAEPHHVNEDRSDNRPANLVACQDRAYHKLLHQRMRAYVSCGHADWRLCRHCHQYDAPENLWINPNNNKSAHHRECAKKYRDDNRERYRETRRIWRAKKCLTSPVG